MTAAPGGSRESTWALLRTVPLSLRVYTFGLGVGYLGTGVARLALPWLVYDLTRSAAALGLLGFAQLATAWIAPLIGLQVDRMNRRTAILVGASGQGVCVSFVAATVTFGHPSVLTVMLAALAASVFARFLLQANSTVRQALTPPRARVAFNTWQFTVYNVSWYLSPGVAGLVIAGPGVGMALWLAAIAPVAIAVPALFLPPVSPGDAAGRSFAEGVRSLGAAWTMLRGLTDLWWLAWFGMFWNAGWTAVSALSVYFYRANLGLGADQVGLVNLLAGSVTTAAGLVTPWVARRLSGSAMVRLVLLASGLGMLGMAASATWTEAAAALSGVEGTVTWWDVLVATTTQHLVPHRVYGRVSALRIGLSMGGMPLASLAAGLAASAVGAPAALAAVGAVTLAALAALPRTPLGRITFPEADQPVAGRHAPDAPPAPRTVAGSTGA